jgi:pyrroloquinoline quinone biosynthesis protein B
MQLHVLGSAAGGGVPQWNCGCSNCAAAREMRLPHRTQASLAASADGRSWVLFNATTDVRRQIESDRALAPRGLRDSPIRAIFLTDANIDHCAGLLDFRQAGPLQVYSTDVVRETLCANAMYKPFSSAPRMWETVDGRDVTVSGLRIRAIRVSGLMPAFSGGRPVEGAAVAFSIEDETGAKCVYAPVFLDVGEELARAADDADAAFFDGSFWTDDELGTLGLGTRTAREMGHAPIDGPGGSLAAVRASGCARKFYTHVNNSNPLLDPSSAASERLRAAGIELAQDGAELTLDPRARRVSAGA